MANIKEALEYAKLNPDTSFATELKRRIESGSMNQELKDAGLPQFGTDIVEDTLVEKLSKRKDQIMSGFGKFGEAYDEAMAGEDTLGSQIKKDVSGVAKIVGGVAGGINDVIGAGLDAVGVDDAIEAGVKALPEFAQAGIGEGAGYLQSKLEEYAPQGGVKRDVADAIGNMLAIIPVGKAGQIAKRGAESVAKKTAEKVAEEGVAGLAKTVSGVGLMKNVYNKVINSDLGEKYIVKPLADISESQMFELAKPEGLIKNIDESLNYAKKSLADKSLPSLFTQAGNRFENAIQQVSKLKTGLGQKMGAIEDSLSQAGKTLVYNGAKTMDTLKKYGLQLVDDVESGVKSVDSINPLLKDVSGVDFNKLTSAVNASLKALENGDTKVIREVSSHLKSVARDNFDQVLNKYTDKTYQVLNDLGKALDNEVSENVLKNLSETQANVYKNLMTQYAKYSKATEQAFQLVGKEGIEGGRVKAGSVAKAISQSIHNQAETVRQIANFVKEKTGYDFFKDANNADLLMQAVGDFRGQSLNRAINEVTTNLGGTMEIIKKLFQMAGQTVISKEKNIENLLRKYNPVKKTEEAVEKAKKVSVKDKPKKKSKKDVA